MTGSSIPNTLNEKAGCRRQCIYSMILCIVIAIGNIIINFFKNIHCIAHSTLHNLQGPVQNENVEALVKS